MSKFLEGLPDFLLTKLKGLLEPKVKVEIVGESLYKENFKQLRATMSLSNNPEAKVKVQLVQELKNPHSSDGKAVAAYVKGEMVGHVSR
jgi:flagella basal body P-ring formation protein FlgA